MVQIGAVAKSLHTASVLGRGWGIGGSLRCSHGFRSVELDSDDGLRGGSRRQDKGLWHVESRMLSKESGC